MLLMSIFRVGTAFPSMVTNPLGSSGSSARSSRHFLSYPFALPDSISASSASASAAAPSASRPSPSLVCQYSQSRVTSGATRQAYSAKGCHHQTLLQKYSPSLLVGFFPQTSIPITSTLLCPP